MSTAVKPPPRSGTKKVEPAYRALIRTIGLLKRAMEPYFAQHGISASQWEVLRTLNQAEDDGAEGVRLTDLSDHLLVRPPSVTGAVDRLERLGLVERKASRADHRERLVTLTGSGRRMVERVSRGHATRVKRVLSALSITEQQALNRLLDRLADHLEVFTNGNNHTNHD